MTDEELQAAANEFPSSYGRHANVPALGRIPVENFLNRDKALMSKALDNGRDLLLHVAQMIHDAEVVYTTCPHLPEETT